MPKKAKPSRAVEEGDAASAESRASELGRAVREGDAAAVESLLAKGVGVEAMVISPGGNSVSPLMLAAMHEGRAPVLEILLRAGAETDKPYGPDQETALIVCCSRGDDAAAKVLIDGGAKLDVADAHGRSALFMSCLGSHPECAALLVAAGAPIEQTMSTINPGATALYAAAIGRRCLCCAVHCASILCDAGARVDARTDQGATAFMVACQYGHLQLVMLLSSHGASRGPAPFEGEPPRTYWGRDLAEESGSDHVVEWLDASADFTPLHHAKMLEPERARALLRSGKFSPVAGRPSAACCARATLERHPHHEASKLIVLASEPWSQRTHALWGEQHRARAFELLKIGYQLRAKLEQHGSVIDWWVSHVMPHALSWDVEPPEPEPAASEPTLAADDPISSRTRAKTRGRSGQRRGLRSQIKQLAGR